MTVGKNSRRADGVDPALARLLTSGDHVRDPGELLAQVNRRAGCDLTLVGVAEHGVSGGAVYVQSPDGRPGVVTLSPTSPERMRQTADVLADARAAGVPVPRHDVIVELDDGVVALVQERLDGAPAGRVDPDIIDAMVATNELFAGLLAGRPDVPIPMLPDTDYDLLENHSARTRRLLRIIREVGESGPREMTGDDLVHPDYTLGNVLYDESGRVTGVVDWNWGALRGDRHFALVKIYIDLFWMTLSPSRPLWSAMNRLDEIVDELISPSLLRLYWSHITLNQLQFWIRDNNAQAIELFLRFGEHRLLA